MVVMVLRTIEAFRVFDIIYVMTGGGPADSTKTASFYVYQEYFNYSEVAAGPPMQCWLPASVPF